MQEPGTKDKEAEEITLRLADMATQENVLVLKYGPNLLAELEGLTHGKQAFDVVIVDATQTGFLFSSEEMIAAADISRTMLEVQGALVFVKHDKAAAFIKESPVGYLSFHIFETFSAVYDYSTTIAKYIQQAMGQTIEIRPESSDLSEQILLTIIPVLTNFGIKLKASVEGNKRRNLVLCSIDNYTPLNTITQRLSQQMNFNELLDELRQLEKSGAIYPIFPKIPFLVQQFRSGKQFKLKDYLLEAKLLSREQLDEVIFAMRNSKGVQRLSLGSMCVSKGLISARQLEIAMQDQAFFGQTRESEKTKVRIEADADSHVQSLVGNLKTTDPAGMLQNLANNRCNGVVVVEYRDLTFRAVFELGRLTYAKQNKLKGNCAVTEFVSVWKEGVYVFLERSTPPDLSTEECRVTRPIDKMILDSALASDNIEAIWKQLSRGPRSVLEKITDHAGLLSGESLTDPQEGCELSLAEIEHMQRIWNLSDGISTIEDTIKRTSDLTTLQAATAISRLLYYELLRAPEIDLGTPLAKFRSIIRLISEKIGIDQSAALLRIALRESQGYSAIARVFSLGQGCEVGVDLSAAKTASLSLSNVVRALEDWQVKYIEHVSQELDKSVLRGIVLSIYKR
jgi:hypothetical protein